jgi:predicted TPR repeat methyltransferase
MAPFSETAPDNPMRCIMPGCSPTSWAAATKGRALIEKEPGARPRPRRLLQQSRHQSTRPRQADQAIAAYQRAISLDPDHANAHGNLGVLLRATGKPVEAEIAYRTAIRLDPEHIDAHTNLGILLTASKRDEEALACYCRVITLRPKHREARRLRAMAHCTIGEIDAAVKSSRNGSSRTRPTRLRGTCSRACTGRNVPPRASNAFVTGIFDSFAASFDAKLASLAYRAPALVVAMLEIRGGGPRRASMCSMPAAEPGYVVRCSFPMLGGCRVSICPPECWIGRGRRMSTTSSYKAS